MVPQRSSKKEPEARASSTDDVECFFSMTRDSLGRNFNSKQVKFGIRKIYGELLNAWAQICPFITILPVILVSMKGHCQA